MDGTGDNSTKRPLLEQEEAEVSHQSHRESRPSRRIWEPPTPPIAVERYALLEEGPDSPLRTGNAQSPEVGRLPQPSRESDEEQALVEVPADEPEEEAFEEERPTRASLISDLEMATPRRPRFEGRQVAFSGGLQLLPQSAPPGPSASTGIEMAELQGSPASSSSGSGAQPPRDNDRHCFICLLDADKDSPLLPCCSTCYASTHIRCWREWRSNQHRTALRSRLLGLRAHNQNLLRCTICKSGTAVVAGEEGGLEWMNELLCGNDPGENSVLARLAAAVRRDDSDEDIDASLEDLIDTRTCVSLMVYVSLLVMVLLAACVLIVMQKFYAGDVVLCCIIAFYELSVLQIVVIAVGRRRHGMITAATALQEEAADPESNPREVPLPS